MADDLAGVPVEKQSPFGWFLVALKKYAVFRGRACRREFWYFVLFMFLIEFGLSFVFALFTRGGEGVTQDVSALFALVFLIPTLAVSVRRLHDTGKTGWWLFLSLVPLVGSIVLIIFYCQDSQPGPNMYGGDPKTLPA